jgi:hypothetical protein
MSKKISSIFSASIVKNQAKGGAWMATITLSDEGIDTPFDSYQSAWANASAAKRWIKELVQSKTPRKSVKMVASDLLDAKNKPTRFDGAVSYKRDA